MPTKADRSATVLITGAGTVTCQSVIKGLRAQQEFDVRIVTVDMCSGNAGRFFSDYFETIPAADSPDFVPQILRICQQQEVDLVIPIVDYEFKKMANVRAAFAELDCRLVLSDAHVIETCNDKWKTFQFFRQQAVLTPDTWLPSDICTADLPYPVFIKPRLMGRGSIDTHAAGCQSELENLLPTLDSPLIQQLLTGTEYTVDILCDFAGRIVNGVVRERTETKAGVSYKGITVRNQDILDQAVSIAEALPIIGPANLQCFWDEGQATFFEINPRYSGTLALSIAAGFNSPLWLLRLHKQLAFPRCIGEYQTDVKMYRFWQEVFVDAEGNQPSLPLGPTVLP